MKSIIRGPQTIDAARNDVNRLEKAINQLAEVDDEIAFESERVADEAARALASDSGELGDPRDLFDDEEGLVEMSERFPEAA